MWLTDPELFLYSKFGGDDVQVWRCKKPMISSSSPSPLVVPMIPDDFEYVSQVEDHSDLVDGNILDWEETDYKALVKYISERRLLVNGQGLVIAELSKFDEEAEDGNQMDANAKLPIYLRSLDILSLKTYIPKLRERPIPLRAVQYLEDTNGTAAPVERREDDSIITSTSKEVAKLQDELNRERNEKLTLTKRVADAETMSKTLEAKNMNLEGTNIRLKQDVAARDKKVTDLESKNKTLEEKVPMLTADLVVWKQKFTDLESKSTKDTKDQGERITKLTADIAVWEGRLKISQSTNETLRERIKKLNADLARAQHESWRNDLMESDWTGVERLTCLTWFSSVTILEGQGTYTVDDGKSNVRARCWYQVRLNSNKKPFKGIAIRDLVPNREKARFNNNCWTVNSNNGIQYVVTNI